MRTKTSNVMACVRGLRAERAAEYLDIGKTKFLELVEKGILPEAVVIDGMRIWDRLELDAAFEAAKEAGEPSERNSFDKILQLNR